MKYFGQQVFRGKSQSVGCQMKAEVAEVWQQLSCYSVELNDKPLLFILEMETEQIIVFLRLFLLGTLKASSSFLKR